MKILSKKNMCMWLIIVLVSFPCNGLASSFSDITSESIKDKENQIENAQDETNALKELLTDIENIKKELENKREDLDAYIVQLDSSLDKMIKNIQELEDSITFKEAELEATEVELDTALAIEKEQYESMKIRVQFIYEAGSAYYLDLIFGAEKFSDLLNRIDYIAQLSAYDKQMLDEYTINRNLIDLCKQQLDADKAFLDEAKVTLDVEKKSLEQLITEKANQIEIYTQDINNQEKAIAEYEAEIIAQEEMIAALEKAVAEERKEILASNGVVLTYDGGTFVFPMESYTRMSSDYGMRMHPIYNVYKMHYGVDFAAPTGTAIYAAYDGVVVASTYQSSMGNYVMINHGNDLYTVYLHASALYVSEGDIVARGETIAAVGTTGDSTGPHLDFRIRENGVYVHPNTYINY